MPHTMNHCYHTAIIYLGPSLCPGMSKVAPVRLNCQFLFILYFSIFLPQALRENCKSIWYFWWRMEAGGSRILHLPTQVQSKLKVTIPQHPNTHFRPRSEAELSTRTHHNAVPMLGSYLGTAWAAFPKGSSWYIFSLTQPKLNTHG